jgi:hypothetical protein
MPNQFAVVDSFPVRLDGVNIGQVCIWRYLGELPAGPSELPVTIPTAGIIIKPAD